MVKMTLVCFLPIKDSHLASLTIDAEMTLAPAQGLRLRYELTGDLTRIRIPAPEPPGAQDGLWQHTCFEAFIAVQGEAGYREFNFSPSGQWAACAFSDYRLRKTWMIGQAPIISVARASDSLVLEAYLAATDLPPATAGKSLQIGLSAVVESNDGSLSYWALHHPSAHPDFHDKKGFTCSLPL